MHACEDLLLMLKPLNPCPVCGAETALAEIQPHPLHVSFRFMDTFVTGAGRSNPWLFFAGVLGLYIDMNASVLDFETSAVAATGGVFAIG